MLPFNVNFCSFFEAAEESNAFADASNVFAEASSVENIPAVLRAAVPAIMFLMALRRVGRLDIVKYENVPEALPGSPDENYKMF